MDPFALLEDHPDVSLTFTTLPEGEHGRWYPDLRTIVLDEGLTQAQRRCTLLHELVHVLRGDSHLDDEVQHARMERTCHHTVARALIPFPTLLAAMQWGRDPQEIADELWVDLDTLEARIAGLSPVEAERLAVKGENEEKWSVA